MLEIGETADGWGSLGHPASVAEENLHVFALAQMIASSMPLAWRDLPFRKVLLMRVPPALADPLGVIPVFMIERAARLAFTRVMKAHPGLFERLGDYRQKRYGFVPDDLPIGFLVEPSRLSLTVVRKPKRPEADAAVEGPLFLLLALLEGRCDADALFFSRDLTVTGDMEAMLALRNALDDSNIDLPKDLGQASGPFAPLVSRALTYVRDRALTGEAGQWN